MKLKVDDVIEFYDPLQKKRVEARVTANLGAGPSGSKDDRVYVSNPEGVSYVYPDMKPVIVGRYAHKARDKCACCGQPL